MTEPDFAAIRARAQTALPACYDPHRTTIVLSVAEVNALLAAIDELTGQVDDAGVTIRELLAYNDKLVARIDVLEAALDKTQQQCNEWRRAAKDVLAPQVQALEARNAKLEAVAEVDVRDMANFCIAQGASKPWQEIAHRLLAALDALDG